jgi:uncharacterized protein (DUF1015 family)
MADIKPFRGILYNQKKADIARVITPPYDVISKDMQGRFYQRDEHNIVRLILGKVDKSDTSRNNRYTRAKALLDRWLEKRLLVKDRKPAVYVYSQEYLHKGRKRIRLGFIALMKIEDPKESGILPHEYTLDKPKADRLSLMAKTRSNLSPIFSLFQDEKNRINKMLKSFIKSRPPLFKVEAEGVTHKFWRMENRHTIKSMQVYMRGKKIFIADGHHRYEVALAYRDKMRKSVKNRKSAVNYVMMYFSNLNERENLTILSTHRVVRNINPFDEKKIKLKLKKYFYIKNIKKEEHLFESLEKGPKARRIFGMYAGKKRFYLLTSKKADSRFDVTVLHDLIINKILCVKNPENSIKYIRNEKHASALVDKGKYRIAFFLRPTKVGQMKTVAERGEMMPQKSTYFYPKLLTGLVINKF